jgi:hypothetical protein
MARTGLQLLLAALLIMAGVPAWAAGREEKIENPRPDRTWGRTVGGMFVSGKSIAVVIGISNYIGEVAGGYAALPTAKHDAEKMVRFLLNDAGFDTVYVLTDEYATKQKIDRLMTDVPTEVGPRDRFLFYWSGHGAGVSGPAGRRFRRRRRVHDADGRARDLREICIEREGRRDQEQQPRPDQMGTDRVSRQSGVRVRPASHRFRRGGARLRRRRLCLERSRAMRRRPARGAGHRGIRGAVRLH